MNCSHDTICEKYSNEVARCYAIVKNKGKANVSIQFIADFCDEWNKIRKEINPNAEEYSNRKYGHS